MSDPRPPDRVVLAGRYRLRSVLGRGGMATVYAAWDTAEERACAVKVLRSVAARSAQLTRRFLDEAQTMQRLRHPHVVAVHDVGAHEGRAFLVMELLTGGAVSDRLAEAGALVPAEAARVAVDALEGLAAAHALGIVHRDVKPQNLLLDADGRVRITDFGVARRAADAAGRTRTGAQLGTLAYMPPEQRHDPRQVGPASDVYAVGATLYTLLTARRPIDLFMEDVREERLRDLPEHLRGVVARACAYHPSDRFSTAQEMAAALEPLAGPRVGGSPLDAPGVPPGGASGGPPAGGGLAGEAADAPVGPGAWIWSAGGFAALALVLAAMLYL